MKQGLVRLLYNFGKRFMGWTLHMIMCVLLCYPVSIHMSQLLSTGRPISSSDCPRVAKHALVLGLGDHVQSDPTVSAPSAQLTESAFQPDLTQESGEPESTCLAPRVSAMKEQGFSEAVAARIEAPQRSSTRSVYEAKWTIFTKWLHKNIRHQSDWSQVSLYPSPSFLSKNQLAKEGPDSVASALAPTLDKSLKGDRSLCPVRALRYYLDRT